MNRKTKYSIKFKEDVIREFQQGHSGSEELSVKHGISARYLRRLITKYEEQDSLSRQDVNNHYGKDFKIVCVLSVLKKGLSLSEATSRFGIPSDSTLVNWIKLYHTFGEEGLETTKMGCPKSMPAPKRQKKEKTSDPGIAGSMSLS